MAVFTLSPENTVTVPILFCATSKGLQLQQLVTGGAKILISLTPLHEIADSILQQMFDDFNANLRKNTENTVKNCTQTD